jgi:cysteine peptidase B
MKANYQSIADEEGSFVDAQSINDVSEKYSTENGIRMSKLVKAGILASCAGMLSFLAVQSKVSFEGSRGTGVTPISKLTSLDQLPADTVFAEVSDNDQNHIFGLYQRKYSKAYDDKAYSAKLSTFKTTLSTIDVKNSQEKARGGSARHGITKYSDMSLEELKSTLLSAKPNKSEKQDVGVALKATVAKYTGSATAKDWSGILTTPVIDQGYCGSCYAFSTVFQIESDAIRAGLLTTSDSLSAQELINCDTEDMGCDGGWTELGFSYAMQNGLSLAADYPYSSYFGKAGSCTSMDAARTKIKVENFYELSSEDEMVDYVLSTGPLSICAASSDWYTYVGGVMTSCGGEVDHCIQVVGVDKEQGFWKVRNTWGDDWGEDGYLRISLGSNTCGLLDDPIYTEVSLMK